MAVEVEAWRYAGGSEAKAMALCYTTVEPKVRLSSVALWEVTVVCQVMKVAITVRTLREYNRVVSVNHRLSMVWDPRNYWTYKA